MPEKTAEDFITDAEGIRWFKTGDIGQLEEDGKLTIVDRKKDLVKLQLGEYISLGKVESELKTCPIVDNCCIYGDGMQNYVVALVVPAKERLETIGEKLGLAGLNFEQLCKNKDVTGAVLKELTTHGKRVGLQKFELPGNFRN
jgi:long-chain acyl-CoA synthetase